MPDQTPAPGPCPIDSCDWDAEGTLDDHLFTQHDEEDLAKVVVRLALENDRLRARDTALRDFLDRDTNDTWPDELRPTNLAERLLAENDQLRATVDELTSEIAEGVSAQTMLKGLNVHDGQVHLEVEPAREMLLILVASMRTMLDDAGAENYLTTDAEFPPAVHLDLQDGQHPGDAYTLTVQRRHKPTAHDLRRVAEAQRDAAQADSTRLRTRLTAMAEAWKTRLPDTIRTAVAAEALLTTLES